MRLTVSAKGINTLDASVIDDVVAELPAATNAAEQRPRHRLSKAAQPPEAGCPAV
ncbi:hypothetical protein [Gephyromycinifex aptenodytis]|uniref:hypothetical protein n=1 Tax=Gephyromycinifex aptenodytis TaxID=2716227 RepID=UPI001B2FE9C0